VLLAVWVGFCPPREASPSSSEDDVDEVYRYGGGEEREMGAWDKGLEQRFRRIVTIVDRTTDSASPSPASSGLTLTLEGADDDNGVALLTDAQIREGCAFLWTVSGTNTPPSPPRYSSFPPSPPSAHSPRGSAKKRVLILAPRTRAVDVLSLATAYVVARGWGQVGSVHTPLPRPSSTSSSSSRSSTKVPLPDTTFSTLTASTSCADTRSKEESNCEATTNTTPSTGNNLNPNLAREDAQEDIDAD